MVRVASLPLESDSSLIETVFLGFVLGLGVGVVFGFAGAATESSGARAPDFPVTGPWAALKL